MIKYVLGLCLLGFVAGLFFFLENPLSAKEENIKIQEVSVLTVDGDSVKINEQNYPHKLILNFYGTDCSLCMAEVNEIVSFSRKYKVGVLFVTADSVDSINRFRHELEKQNITDDHIMFAKISLKNAYKLFGDLIVPQTILLEDSLQVAGIKKGILSYSFLRKSFE